jgi:hypothetical protein
MMSELSSLRVNPLFTLYADDMLSVTQIKNDGLGFWLAISQFMPLRSACSSAAWELDGGGSSSLHRAE